MLDLFIINTVTLICFCSKVNSKIHISKYQKTSGGRLLLHVHHPAEEAGFLLPARSLPAFLYLFDFGIQKNEKPISFQVYTIRFRNFICDEWYNYFRVIRIQ